MAESSLWQSCHRTYRSSVRRKSSWHRSTSGTVTRPTKRNKTFVKYESDVSGSYTTILRGHWRRWDGPGTLPLMLFNSQHVSMYVNHVNAPPHEITPIHSLSSTKWRSTVLLIPARSSAPMGRLKRLVSGWCGWPKDHLQHPAALVFSSKKHLFCASMLVSVHARLDVP